MVVLTRRRVLGLGLGLLCLAGRPGHAQEPRFAAEYQIKAAYLYKFLAFTEWPAQAFDGREAPIVIGVLGAEALAMELSQAVAGRAVDGRAVTVRELRGGEATSGLHVLFVGRSAARRLPALLGAARGQPLLTVGESDDATAPGTAITFVVVDDKVRFDVAPAVAEQAGLKISARLLAVARKVHAGPT